MNSDELKQSKKYFTSKNVQNITDLSNIQLNIKKLLAKNEEVIINYLERFIYTSNISEHTKTDILAIFEEVDNDIIN
jgi:hypothetical protein